MSSWRWKERSEAPVHTRGQPVALCGTSSDLNLEFGSTPPPLTLPSQKFYLNNRIQLTFKFGENTGLNDFNSL